jgi:hypothetical protein
MSSGYRITLKILERWVDRRFKIGLQGVHNHIPWTQHVLPGAFVTLRRNLFREGLCPTGRRRKRAGRTLKCGRQTQPHKGQPTVHSRRLEP